MKTQRLLALASLLCCSLHAVAWEYLTVDNIRYIAFNNGEACVTAGGQYSGTVSIPESLIYRGRTLKVTAIGSQAFERCTELTAVSIPNSVVEIDVSAFNGCSSLASVVLPNMLTRIGSYVFANCTQLTGIQLPATVTSIEEGAFASCTSLASIDIPDAVKVIRSEAFMDCSALTSLSIPSSVDSIEPGAFGRCLGIATLSVDSENARYSTDGHALLAKIEGGHMELAALIVPTPAYVVPDGVTHIADVAFAHSSQLASISLPRSLKSIGAYAFLNCTSLASATLPDSLERIGTYAFGQCAKLTNIHIPASVAEIGASAFSGCTGMASLSVAEGNNTFYTDGQSLLAKKGGDQIELIGWLVATPSYAVPNGVKQIGNNAFQGRTGLTGISLPHSVMSLGEYAFDGCSGLTSITLPDSLKSIGFAALSQCTGLTSLRLPESTETIGPSAFYGCTGLKEVVLGAGLGEIGYSAFAGCAQLDKIACLAPTPPQTDDTAFDATTYGSAQVGVPPKSLEAYQASSPWSLFTHLQKAAPTGVPSIATGGAAAGQRVYDLQGRPQPQPMRGLNIIGGKKVIVR